VTYAQFAEKYGVCRQRIYVLKHNMRKFNTGDIEKFFPKKGIVDESAFLENYNDRKITARESAELYYDALEVGSLAGLCSYLTDKIGCTKWCTRTYIKETLLRGHVGDILNVNRQLSKKKKYNSLMREYIKLTKETQCTTK